MESNVVHMFVMMNGEVQKYHGKFCLVPICFWSVLRLISSSIDQYYTPKWVSFLAETLFYATCNVGGPVFETVPDVLRTTVAPLKTQLVTSRSHRINPHKLLL